MPFRATWTHLHLGTGAYRTCSVHILGMSIYKYISTCNLQTFYIYIRNTPYRHVKYISLYE